MDRRTFLYQLGGYTAGLALACRSLEQRANAVSAFGPSLPKATGYGNLAPMAAKNANETFLALPQGFEYNVISRFKSLMSDGHHTPPLHDGMATFKVNKELRLIRNHEIRQDYIPRPGGAISKSNNYDESAGGGTTTLVVDPKTREITRHFVSLSGTLVNCAGGASPWGSWISCEETTIGPSIRTEPNGDKIGGFLKPHGFCFEVSAAADTNAPPVPLRAMGRFTHEAVGFDRKTGAVYMTEDKDTAGFYRFLPSRNKRLAEGGVLQMLAVKGKPEYDTRTGQMARATFAANWVTIDNPDPQEADIDDLAVYKQGVAKGAATFARLEGCCTDEKGRAYFASTSGGDKKGGQIWLYEPASRSGGKLILLYESPDRNILDMPDNICLRPQSELIFMCEDSDYVNAGPGTADNFIRILTPNGQVADFARNITPGFITSEFAGSTFSADGKILFVNLQAVGATFAIWGDWDRFKYS